MPRFLFTPVSGDPFAAAQEYASELGGAPPGPAAVAGLASAFGRDVNRLVSGIGGAFNSLGNSLMGQTSVAVGPDGSVSPIDPGLVDAAGTLSGLAAEGGFAMPKPEGALGVFAGRNSATADLQMLDFAKRYEGQGLPPELIHRETGWFRGADGEWRYEIPDTGATFASNVLKPEGPEMNTAWWNRLHDLAAQQGYFDFHDMAKNAPEAEVNAVRDAATADVGARAPLGVLMSHPDLFAAYPDLMHRPVYPTKANATYSGLYNPLGDFFEVEPSRQTGNQDQDSLSIALHEIQHAIQQREGFAQGGSPREPEMTQAGGQIVSDMQNRLQALKAQPIKSDEDAEEILYLTRMLGQISTRPLGDLGYHTLAGEVESRNVEMRNAFGAYDTPPWQTEDVPRQYQNVRVIKPAGVGR